MPLFIILGALVFLVFCVVYRFDVRDKLEDALYDLRTKIQPHIGEDADIAVITIDDEDIESLAGPKATHLDVGDIIHIAQKVLEQRPQAIGLILPHQDFDYSSASFRPVGDLLAKNQNVYLGVFDTFSANEPLSGLFPLSLMATEDQVYGASTARLFRQGVVRSLPLVTFLDSSPRPQIWTQLAMQWAERENKTRLVNLVKTRIANYNTELAQRRSDLDLVALPQFDLRHHTPDEFLTIRSRDLLTADQLNFLTGRIVLIGYTSFRSRTIKHRDGTRVNTPWDGEENPEENGTPLIYVQATALENLMNGSWLQRAPLWSNLLQTVLVSVVSFFVWGTSPALAVVLFTALSILLLIGHACLMAFAHILLPLADTLLFAVAGTMVGAFLRAQKDSKRRTIKELKVKGARELAGIQSQFLDRFASELFQITEQIAGLLNQYQERFTDRSTLAQTFQKAHNSCDELRDYLAGIRQYAMISDSSINKINLHNVDLQPMIRRVLNQFETQINDQALKILVQCEDACFVWTDELFIEPIIFNLISNAIKYSPHGGKIAIATTFEGRRKILFSVKDEGPGIAPELQERIFEKFYRIKDDNVFKIKGNGLGLFLCRFFAQRIGTPISLMSSSGNGSTFQLTIPRGMGLP